MAKLSELTRSIREVLLDFGPDAPLGTIRDAIRRKHPELDSQLTVTAFRSRVLQQRDWARRQSSGRRIPANSSTPGTLERYNLAIQFLQLCGGNAQHAEELLGFLGGIDPTELQQAFEGWQQLVATAGGEEKAKRVLASMHQYGMI